MLKKFVKNFFEVNESLNIPLKGKPAIEFLPELRTIIRLCSKLQKIHYPAGIHGYSSKAINLKSNEPGIVKEFSHDEALDIISEELFKIDEFYKNYYAEPNKQLVTFYIWQAGGTELTHDEIEKLLSSAGGQTTPQNIKSEELIAYLKKNPEKAELITRISIDLDSYATRELGQALSRGDFGRLD